MKISGGKFKGRKLITPPSDSQEIRPLRSRIRKAIFDMLAEDMSGWKILDLFAGTGALGIECLSRNADFAVFIDSSPVSISIIKRNLKHLGIEEKAKVFEAKLPGFLKKEVIKKFSPFDLVFITPPYKKGLAVKTLEKLSLELLEEDAVVILEEHEEVEIPEKVGEFSLIKSCNYGETTIYFFKQAKQ